MYYVDLDTEEYTAFKAEDAYADLHLEHSGSSFFRECRKNLKKVIHPEDLEKILAVMEKKEVISLLDKMPVYSIDYRKLANGQTEYCRLKLARPGSESRGVVIGISNIHTQSLYRQTQETKLQKVHRDSLTYARIAQALTGEYFSIYYVNLDTNAFIEFSSADKYKELQTENNGIDFFESCLHNAPLAVHEDDLETVLYVLNKENMLKELDENGSISVTYRLVNGGKSVYAHMKIILMEDSENDSRHVVVGVSNIDAQIRRELKFAEAQALAKQNSAIKKAAIIGGIIVSVILIFGTMWMGRIAKKDTEDAVRSVSLLYLDELAGRREQVIASNLKKTIDNFQVATGLLEPYDLQDIDHLQAFQRRMKQLYGLEKFAFVDSSGLIYTAQGLQNDIDSYQFDYRALTGPEISIKNIESKNKSVIIAIPLKKLPFNGKTLVASFMEIDMQRMLEGVSLQADGNKTTFCNIYTKAGIPLTNVVLGGLSADTNLLQAMESAIFDSGNSLEKMKQDFARGKDGYVSFTYNKIAETMYYVPIKGTTWMLTYLIRESLISEQISSITNSMMSRNLAQILLTAAVLMAMFMFMLRQMRRAARLELEKETFEAETRVKQQELEQRLSLQEKLLEQDGFRLPKRLFCRPGY